MVPRSAVCTKRPHLAARLAPWDDGWPDNVWLGTTVEDQRWADKRLPKLSRIPATIRFLSCEPLLGPVELGPWLAHGDVHWVIAGGESGPRARPSDPHVVPRSPQAVSPPRGSFPLQAVGRVGSNCGPRRVTAISYTRRRIFRTARPFRKEGERSQPRRKDLERYPGCDGTGAFLGQLINCG